MDIKNLKVMAASLCLGATLLTGCGNKIPNISSKLTVENNKLEGNISYEDLDEHVEIISFEQDGKENTMLCLKTVSSGYYTNGIYSSYTTYYDLVSGAPLIQYIKAKDKVTYLLGESLSVKVELPLTPYLVTEGFVKNKYTADEVVEFFNEKVKPSLVSKEKELVK